METVDQDGEVEEEEEEGMKRWHRKRKQCVV